MAKGKTKAKGPKTLKVLRTFGWEGKKWTPGKRFPADHAKAADFVRAGYLQAPKG
jgi:hypothetical protein